MNQQRQLGPVVLVVMDGWGLAPPAPGNAIELAETPNFDRVWASYPHTTLKTSGVDVGLPRGQMGNSEVGHLNLGAGVVVFQSITRIDLSIERGDFFENPELLAAISNAKQAGKWLHLMGLLSDGGVHAHIRHLDALLELAARQGVERVAIHAFLDGRDTSPTGGVGYLRDALGMCAAHGRGQIATVVGRYYAMDRDHRWERVKVAYDLLTTGAGERVGDPLAAVERHYVAGQTDEFMPAIALEHDGQVTTIHDRDSIIFFNFRADRGRQLTQALLGVAGDVPGFAQPPRDLTFVTLTEYSDSLPARVAYSPHDVVHPIARVVSEASLKQFHTAETEKYAHVTYFFNGGREEPFEGEERALAPSPKVATYDLQPEMNAAGVADEAVAAIESGQYALLVLNFANCDMVGHTGVIAAAIAATETVDAQLQRVVDATLQQHGALLITADHGNAEEERIPGTDTPMTAHTTNPVPLLLVAPDDTPWRHAQLRADGRLADVAPTLLELLELRKPAEMTGESLVVDARSTRDDHHT